LEKDQTYQTKNSSKACKSPVWLSMPVKTKQSDIHKGSTVNRLHEHYMFKHLALKTLKVGCFFTDGPNNGIYFL
jgi:hypothetical protein